MATLEPGDAAPAFSLKDQAGATVRLADFTGRKLLVYFYPKAGTSGCTKQACAVRDAEADLAKVGTAAVGISPDAPEKQQRFDDAHTLGFPLLSDPDHAVAKAWGAWGEKTLYGKTHLGIIRSAFLVDETGAIQAAWYKVKPADTVANVLDALGR